MLNLDVDVIRGVTFIRLEGDLTSKTFRDFDLEVDNLLYNLGMSFYVISFVDIFNIDESIFSKLQNKLYEIFLSCGDVVMCGIDRFYKDKRLKYISNEIDAFKYFKI